MKQPRDRDEIKIETTTMRSREYDSEEIGDCEEIAASFFSPHVLLA